MDSRSILESGRALWVILYGRVIWRGLGREDVRMMLLTRSIETRVEIVRKRALWWVLGSWSCRKLRISEARVLTCTKVWCIALTRLRAHGKDGIVDPRGRMVLATVTEMWGYL
jgi:hypothetical protein